MDMPWRSKSGLCPSHIMKDGSRTPLSGTRCLSVREADTRLAHYGPPAHVLSLLWKRALVRRSTYRTSERQLAPFIQVSMETTMTLETTPTAFVDAAGTCFADPTAAPCRSAVGGLGMVGIEG